MEFFEEKILNILSEVNKTLKYYVDGYSSAKRVYWGEKERCTDLKHFIEIRFNYEASKIPEFEELIIKTEGKLFKCTSVTKIDLIRRRFETATVQVNETLLTGDEILKDELNQFMKFLGGSTITFNSLKVKIKFEIN